MRTALFGGSFNPIHNGHIRLARQIIADGHADEVWLLVSPRNPLKSQAGLLDESLRLEMAQAALADEPHITASDFEFHLPRPSYTWNTLQALTGAYPGRQFLLLIGADNWHAFDRWAHHEEIVRHFPILIYPRTDYPIDASALPPGVRTIAAPLFPFSSTDVRDAVRRGENIAGMVPPAIEASVIRAYGSAD